MNKETVADLPKTLPAEYELFAKLGTSTKRALKVPGHVGWYIDTSYYWPKDGSCWKLVEPNPDNQTRRERFHRGPAINPASHRAAGFAALVGATVLENAKVHQDFLPSLETSSPSPEEHEISGSSKWPSGTAD